jgi:predicted nucleic-acid-binding protein
VIGLDTAVLVRFLTQDDPKQSRRANAAVSRAARAGERLHVSSLVLCELTWVLSGAYRLPKERLVDLLRRMLDTPQLDVEDRDLARRALADFEAGCGDFADYLLGRRNQARGCGRTVSFESRLRRAPAFRLLPTG